MSNRMCIIGVTAAVMAVFAAPLLAAEPVVCTVKSDIRVRKNPSMKAPILTILKKDAKVTAAGKCAGGWVKISTEDGRIAGYVGGWALAGSSSAGTSSAEESTNVAATATEPVAEKKDIPTNEQLAIQITEMRVHMVGIERKVKRMNRDIQKIKATLAQNAKAAKTNSAK